MRQQATPTAQWILPYAGTVPMVAADAFVAPGAVLTGDVVIASGASVWFGCVLRGDERAIRVGERSNLQDLAVIHTSRGGWDASIGADVTVGHRVVLHGCRIHDGVLVGIGAIVLDEVEIDSGAVIAAGAVVAPGKRVGAGELWAGVPARKVGEVGERLKATVITTPPHYVAKAAAYAAIVATGIGG
jgi:carbonic anhydrase/acetyltransferase-like protein (isoleucine patch superfamily)